MPPPMVTTCRYPSAKTECSVFKIYTKFEHLTPCSLLSPLPVISHLHCYSGFLIGFADFTSVSYRLFLSKAGGDQCKRYIRSFHSSTQNCTQLKDNDFIMSCKTPHDLAFHDYPDLIPHCSRPSSRQSSHTYLLAVCSTKHVHHRAFECAISSIWRILPAGRIGFCSDVTFSMRSGGGR